jgi:hypothetical protein
MAKEEDFDSYLKAFRDAVAYKGGEAHKPWNLPRPASDFMNSVERSHPELLRIAPPALKN